MIDLSKLTAAGDAYFGERYSPAKERALNNFLIELTAVVRELAKERKPVTVGSLLVDCASVAWSLGCDVASFVRVCVEGAS